jgi:hypothetical protein
MRGASPAELSELILKTQAYEIARDAEDIRPPSDVRLGPLTMTIMEGARWQWKDAFPSSQVFADEVEKVLSYALSQGQFEHYLGRLRGSANQRDAALAELRVAFFFHRNRFPVSQWRPIGAKNSKGNDTDGEYMLRGPTKVDVFTEVKNRGWESELTPEEKKAGRQHQPKHLSFDGRAIGQDQNIQDAIDKAYEKFEARTPNLLIIYDDLFVSLQHGTDIFANQALYERNYQGYFSDSKYDHLGGVGIFWAPWTSKGIEYGMKLYLNPYAVKPLPYDLAKGFHGYLPGTENPAQDKAHSLLDVRPRRQRTLRWLCSPLAKVARS